MSLSPEQRLVVVTNPYSSRASGIKRDVMDRLEDERMTVTELPVPDFPTRAENIQALGQSIQAGDRLLIAGGDGTANTVINAYMEADADHSAGVEIGFLGFGNANDLASTFTRAEARKDPVELAEASHIVPVHPLDISVNGIHSIYAMGYASAGEVMATVGAQAFHNPKHRAAMQNGRLHPLHGTGAVLRSKHQHGHLQPLPPFRRPGDSELHTDTIDTIALNIPHMSLLVRDRARYYDTNEFRRIELARRQLLAMTGLVASALVNLIPTKEPLVTLPGTTTSNETLLFTRPVTVPLQVDGEFHKLSRVRTLSIAKNQSPDAKVVNVVHTADNT